MIRYVAVQPDTPDVARAWGEGETHDESRLQCEIAIREKILGKLSRGYHGRTDVDKMYIIKDDNAGLNCDGVDCDTNFQYCENIDNV